MTAILQATANPSTQVKSSNYVPAHARGRSFSQIIYNTFIPPGPESAKEDQEMWSAAQDFEAQTMSKFIEDWLTSTDATKEFDAQYQESMFNSEMAKAYAHDIVKSGGTNLAPQIYEDMQRHKGPTSNNEGYIV